MTNIKAISLELLEQQPYEYNDLLGVFEYFKENNFENIEHSKIYSISEDIYASLGYDYQLHDELAKNDINGTFDLIEMLFNNSKNPLEVFNEHYYLIESVEKAINSKIVHKEEVKQDDELMDYILKCDSEYIDEEALDSRPLYSIYRKENDVLVYMNITFEELEQFISELSIKETV